MTGTFLSQIASTAEDKARQAAKALAPIHRWATVTGTSPLRIHFDGEPDPLPITPSTLTGGLTAGDRVFVVQYLRRTTIVGQAGGPTPTAPAATGIVFASGWAVAAQDSYTRVGSVVSLYIEFTRTDTEIAVPVSGNIGNVDVGTLPVGLRPAQSTVALTSGQSGRVATLSLTSTGVIRLCAVGGSSNIDTGGALSCGGTYIVAS